MPAVLYFFCDCFQGQVSRYHHITIIQHIIFTSHRPCALALVACHTSGSRPVKATHDGQVKVLLPVIHHAAGWQKAMHDGQVKVLLPVTHHAAGWQKATHDGQVKVLLPVTYHAAGWLKATHDGQVKVLLPVTHHAAGWQEATHDGQVKVLDFRSIGNYGAGDRGCPRGRRRAVHFMQQAGKNSHKIVERHH